MRAVFASWWIQLSERLLFFQDSFKRRFLLGQQEMIGNKDTNGKGTTYPIAAAPAATGAAPAASFRVIFVDEHSACGAPAGGRPRAAAELHLAALRPRQSLRAWLAT